LNIVDLRQKTRPNIGQLKIVAYEHAEDVDEMLRGLPKKIYMARKRLHSVIETLRNALEISSHHFFECRLLAEDTLFTLLVFSAPNLELLWVRMPPCYYQPRATCALLQSISSAAFRTPWGKVHRLGNLKSLYIDLVSMPEFTVKFALPLLLLPKLKDLTLGSWDSSVGGDNNGEADSEGLAIDGQPWVWPIRSSPITRLSLQEPEAFRIYAATHR
jgi:hypothetical protein